MSTLNTTHPVAPEELMALLDGELSASRAQSVSAHTESCPECQRAFASLLHTGHALTSWIVAPAPSEIEKEVQRSAERHGSTTRNTRSSRSRIPKPWTLAVAVCSAALLALVFTSEVRMDRPPATKAVAPLPVDYYARLRSGDNLAVRGLPADQFVATAPGFASHSNGPQGSGAELSEEAKREFSNLQVYEKLQRPAPSRQNGPMIARTVSLAILVKDFDASRKSLDSILVRYNGYAANLSVSTPQGAGRSLEASLRIPAPQLVPALTELKSLGHVENENQNGEEVTEQHADLLARLKNSRETEQRLEAILTERTGKIGDVLEVEQEIARVRGEIEQMEAQQKNLEHRVDFATIDLKLAEEYKAKLDSAAPSFSTEFHNALVNGYRNVAGTLVAVLLFFAEYGPILLFWALALCLPAWLLWRRWRHVASPAM